MARVANALSIATAVSLALLAGASPVQPAQAAVETDCGIEMPCRIETGEYRIRFPAGWDGKTPLGAIIFLHGWRGTAAGEMRNAAWARLADRLTGHRLHPCRPPSRLVRCPPSLSQPIAS